MSQIDINEVILRLKKNCLEGKAVWIITIDDQILQIKSKVSWNKIGHAKLALKNYLYYLPQGTYEQLLESNRIVFTPIRLT